MFWKGRGPASATVVVPLDADRPAVEAARRDPTAFASLYRKYVAHVYSLALYVIDNEIHHRGQATVYLRALGIEDDRAILSAFYTPVDVRVDDAKYEFKVGPGLVNRRVRADVDVRRDDIEPADPSVWLANPERRLPPPPADPERLIQSFQDLSGPLAGTPWDWLIQARASAVDLVRSAARL